MPRKSSERMTHKAGHDMASPNSSKEERELAAGLLADMPRKRKPTKSSKTLKKK
jgi:hypothetical protein